MKFGRRFFSASMAAVMAAASLPVLSYAIEEYDSEDYVWTFNDGDGDLFKVNGSINEKVIEKIEKATGKDYDEITFGDLTKVTTLDLSGMELEGVPGIVEYLIRLRSLDLSENLLCSTDVNDLDLSECLSLSAIDISDNYLTAVPAWYYSMDLAKKDISNNLINTAGQRHVVLGTDTFYFMIDDDFNENVFKDKVLSTLKLSDGTSLPEYFYDPDLPTYNVPETEEGADPVLKNERVYVEFDASKCIKDDKVADIGTIDGEVSIVVPYSSGNPNVRAKFKIYFLDGNDPSSVKIRLETLIAECEAIEKTHFTSGSWQAFEAALKTAKTLVAYADADTDMLKNALDALDSAKNDLVKGVSADTKKVLNDLIKIGESYKEEDYSTASWKKLQKAVNAMKAAVEDPETSIEQANAAIKAFQIAQAELTTTMMSLPDIILKSEFEAIYGEDKTVMAKGVTRGGYKYSWIFNGKDVTLPADFNPEITYESEFEELIRFEVGSASDYQLIHFEEGKTFPGTAVVTLDVSGVYEEGTYRLYKWDKSAKKSEFLKEVEIEDGTVEFTVAEGGDYFISSVLQNFQMISSNFDINHEKLTITGKFKKRYTVADFRNSIENGEAVTILDAVGEPVPDTKYIATGMTAAAANSDVAYTIIIPGDCDGDGYVTAMDAVQILRAIVGEADVLTTYVSKAAADVTGDGWIYPDDAVAILKYSIGME